MDAVALLAVHVVGVVVVGAPLGYTAFATVADRGQRGLVPEAVAAAPRVEFELGHVGPGNMWSRRRVMVRRADEGVAHISLGPGIRRVRGDCFASEETYELALDRGGPLVRARWPVGRAHVTMRRSSDGATVGQAAQPRRWWRRMGLRGGVEFTHQGVRYELRPMRGRRGGAQVRVNGEAVGSFLPQSGSTRCEASVPTTLDDEAQLFLVATAAALDVTNPGDGTRPSTGVPLQADAAKRSAPPPVVPGIGAGGAGGGGGGGGGC